MSTASDRETIDYGPRSCCGRVHGSWERCPAELPSGASRFPLHQPWCKGFSHDGPCPSESAFALMRMDDHGTGPLIADDERQCKPLLCRQCDGTFNPTHSPEEVATRVHDACVRAELAEQERFTAMYRELAERRGAPNSPNVGGWVCHCGHPNYATARLCQVCDSPANA